MRRILSIICTMILTAVLPVSWVVSRSLPADTGRYAAQKYDGWSGVLQAWIFCGWKCEGSFVSWLNRCAAEFEKAHAGVYIECMPVSPAAMEGLGENSIPMPELVFFSPGVLRDANRLAEISPPDSLRTELCGEDRCLPVAMGGSMWAIHPDLCSGIGTHEIPLPAGDGFLRYGPAAMALMSGGIEAEMEAELPGIDLGLPAFSRAEQMTMAEMLDAFIGGELCCMPVTQAEIGHLSHLQEMGKGPAWSLFPSGRAAFTSQLLLAGVTGDGEEYDLARQFICFLLEDESQAGLADIGAFSVTGQTIHAGHSPYAPMDALLNSRPLIVPDAFSEHSPRTDAAITERYLQGGLNPGEAFANLGLSFPEAN